MIMDNVDDMNQRDNTCDDKGPRKRNEDDKWRGTLSDEKRGVFWAGRMMPTWRGTYHSVHIGLRPDDVVVMVDHHRSAEHVEVLHDVLLHVSQCWDVCVVTCAEDTRRRKEIHRCLKHTLGFCVKGVRFFCGCHKWYHAAVTNDNIVLVMVNHFDKCKPDACWCCSCMHL